MSKFQLGDRVICYENTERYKGSVAKVIDSGLLQIFIANPLGYRWAHPKQCRKLVKKERRRLTVVFKDGMPSAWTWTRDAFKFGDETVEFVEVKKK